MRTSDQIHAAIRGKLIDLYGEAIAAETYTALEPLLRPIQSGETGTLPVSEKDTILIAYGDHIQSADKTPLRTLHEFLKTHVHPTINSVHLLPFYPYSSDDGFSVMDYYAVDPALGDWDDIDAMQTDFRLMFDAVFNHISAQSAWFEKYKQGEPPYDEYFISVPPDTDLSDVVRPRVHPLLTPFETSSGTRHIWTTFSEDQIDLNLHNPQVLIALLRILLFYVEHGAVFIRLDAIAYLWKEIGTSSIHLAQTHRIIQLMRDVLDLVAPQTVIITETNVPHEENIAYFGDGYNEAQMVYQFPLPPLVLHTLATGDATALSGWAASLEPTSERTGYFNFTASHDGIGMRPAAGLLTPDEIDALCARAVAHGGQVSYKRNRDGSESPYELNLTYFDAITDPAVTADTPQVAVDRFIVSQAIMLALQGVPGVYLPSLFGSRNWHPGVEQTGRARTINRRKFDADTLTAVLQDADALSGQVFRRYLQLLNVRRVNPAFHPLSAQKIYDGSPSVFGVERIAETQRVLALHNVTSQTVSVVLPPGEWHALLDDKTHQNTVKLAPYQVRWLRNP